MILAYPQDLLRRIAEGAHTSLRGLEVREDSGMTSTVSNTTETIHHTPGGLLLDIRSLQPIILAL